MTKEHPYYLMRRYAYWCNTCQCRINRPAKAKRVECPVCFREMIYSGEETIKTAKRKGGDVR